MPPITIFRSALRPEIVFNEKRYKRVSTHDSPEEATQHNPDLVAIRLSAIRHPKGAFASYRRT